MAAEQKRCRELVGHLGHASWQQAGNAARDGPDREGGASGTEDHDQASEIRPPRVTRQARNAARTICGRLRVACGWTT